MTQLNLTISEKRSGVAVTGYADRSDADEDQICLEQVGETDSVPVAQLIWHKKGSDKVPGHGGLSPRARLVTEAMTVNRLVSPSSEHATPNWMS